MTEVIMTIRELARVAGVSRSTASLAMRNSPALAATTRERVRELARSHGYRRDPVVVTLMNQLRVSRKARCNEKLAYITFGKTRETAAENLNELAYIEGVSRRAHALGYEFEKFWAGEPGLSRTRLSRILHARGIRGIIIAPLIVARGHVSLDWPFFAAATMTGTLVKPQLHRSMHDYFGATRLAMHQLKQRGYQRIGYANLIAQDKLSDNGWLAGYLVRNHLYAADPIPPLLVEAWSKQEFQKWLSRYRPDAIISNSLEPLHLLEQLHVKVPEDVGFCRLDLVSEGSPWAGIDQVPRDVGAAAVDLVVVQMESNEFGLPRNPKTQVVNGIWRDGPTILKSARDSSVRPPATRARRVKAATAR